MILMGAAVGGVVEVCRYDMVRSVTSMALNREGSIELRHSQQ